MSVTEDRTTATETADPESIHVVPDTWAPDSWEVECHTVNVKVDRHENLRHLHC